VRVVRGGGVEAACGGEQREPAAHAEPDHPDPPAAVRAFADPRADRLDVVEGLALAAQQRTERGAHAAREAARAEQIGRDREVAGRGQPVGLLADVVDQPERLVQHDDAGPGPFADGRHGEVGVKLRRGGASGDRDGRDGGLLSNSASRA
jgi:hypothetical protein